MRSASLASRRMQKDWCPFIHDPAGQLRQLTRSLRLQKGVWRHRRTKELLSSVLDTQFLRYVYTCETDTRRVIVVD
jgi:hypothetical protein